ncbi:MAG: PilC/PilY family type IV pilus protein, partial [Magnetococcus sp. WYHC-3]
IRKISVAGNGLSTPAVVDSDGDFIADMAYAGDLDGHLWKFDLSQADPAQWQAAFSGQPLFTATAPPQGTPTGCSGAVTGGYEAVVDEEDPVGNTQSGYWPSTNSAQDHGSHYRRNYWDDWGPANWTFAFPTVNSTGGYELFAWWVPYSSRASNVPYDVRVDGTHVARFTANQKINGGRWNSLGTLNLTSGQNVSVTVTSNSSLNDVGVCVDAVRLLQNSAVVTPPHTQPITVQPEVSRHPDGRPGTMIYFGTGRFVAEEDNDAQCAATQSFYALWDRGLPITDIRNETSGAYGQLLQQSITREITGSRFGNQTYDLRAVSDLPAVWGAPHLGWYLDLLHPGDGQNHGERVFSDPVLSAGRVLFTSGLLSREPCSTEEGGWLYELDWTNGGRLDQTFDLDQDDQFTPSDQVVVDNETLSPSGKRSLVGIPTAPTLLAHPEKSLTHKYISGSAGGTPEQTRNFSPALASRSGRLSWREVQAE